MKKLNLFSRMCSPRVGSQKDEGSTRLRVVFDSFTCRLRVCPLKLVSILAILMTIGVGNVWGAEGATYDFSQTLSQVLNDGVDIADVTVAEQSYTVKEVIVSISYNKSRPGATVSVKVGGVTFGSAQTINSSTSTTFTYTGASAVKGQVVVSSVNNCTSSSGNGTFRITNVRLVEGAAAVATPYKVTFYKTDGTSEDIDEDSAGAGVTPPDMAETCGDWEFQGWSTTESDDEESTSELTLVTLDEGVYYPTANTTLYPVYTMEGTIESEVEDVITTSINGKSGTNTSYTSFSNKTLTSDAVYAGQSNNGNNNDIKSVVQLRKDSPSGIVTTTSGGILKQVDVVWNSSTTNGRYITIFGKNTSYSGSEDLYDNSKKGTSLGTIVKNTSTQLVASDDYEYIGILASAALYMTSITLTWTVEEDATFYYSYPDCSSPAQVKTPTFSVSEGSYIENQSVTISCATDGATIYYTTDGNDPTTSSSTYSSAISISTTTTVKAMAVKSGLTDSEIASATYTIRPSKVYNLVTDASSLGVGDKIVILDNSGTYAMSTTQNTNTRGASTDFVLSGTTVKVPDEGTVQAITLEAYAEGYWYFKVGDNYLAATGTSGALLKSQAKATVTSNTTGKWSIALVSTAFTVKTNDGTAYNTMRYNYNSGNPIFNCYDGDKQTAVKVYAYQNTSPTIETNTASLSGFSTTYGGSASDAQNVYVAGRNLNGNITVTPPTGYEIKKSGDASYSSSAITLTPSSKKVSVTLNVRLAAGNNAGNYNGNLTLVGYNSEASTNVEMTGTVAKMTPVITFTLAETAALANTAVGYTLSSTSDATALTFSYKRGDATVSAMITNDTENKTISISQAGTYKIRVNQAADDNHNAAAQVERELTITMRDVFKDMVNGYSDINGDDTGSGITTPTFAEMEDGAQNTCHSTTRYLIGWIKASDLTTMYSGETGYLEDAAKCEANKAKIFAPGTETTASGVTWYAVWGEEKE